MKLSVIIVNYNVKYFLEQALRSVINAGEGIEMEVIIVDNASVDDSVRMVRKTFPQVKLIANQKNVGFSKANNQGIKASLGEYVLLLNPDTVVKEDTFKKCLDFMDSTPDAGGLGIKMIDGSGQYLPESKRGFPTPWVAFTKTFGLGKLFPKSKKFNQYYLGHLSKDEIQKVDVLAGAFMLLRKTALEEIGLLDETFFMYGEDIDLSYRITKGGYQNYYFPHSTIIHYKGESTKKGSLNYVRVFYNAMIIFAKKHFQGSQARSFVMMLQVAIYFRATLTLLSQFLKKIWLPVADLMLWGGGLWLIKDFWASFYHQNKDYYPDSFLWFNIPLYLIIWLGAIFVSGGYDDKYSLRKLLRGLMLGTIALMAVYGLLELQFRSSRAILLMGAAWAALASAGFRLFVHFLRNKNFKIGKNPTQNLVIVGSPEEQKRCLDLLQLANVNKNYIGAVAPTDLASERYLSTLSNLGEVIRIYKVNEVIFCSKDVRTESIMHWMTQLGNTINYKILPKESESIIGSNSKNTSGELYTIDIQYQLNSPLQRRNKRLLDIACSFLFLAGLFILFFLVKNKIGLLKNILRTLLGKTTWVGYASPSKFAKKFPPLKKGILNPSSGLDIKSPEGKTIERLNFFYAKDYTPSEDWSIIWRAYTLLGNQKKL